MIGCRYDPIGPNETVPASLLALTDHPERKRWLAAILLRGTSQRWPGWACQFALATVDAAHGVHQSEFIVRPPFGWEEDVRKDLPEGITSERLLQEGLAPRQAMQILNEIFGPMDVHHNGGIGCYGSQRQFETGAGITASWTLSSILEILGDDLRITLNENSYVSFASILPPRGGLSVRAGKWAKGFVMADLAHRLLRRSLEEYDDVE